MRKLFTITALLLLMVVTASAKINPNLKVVNSEVKEQTYGTQLFYRLPEALVTGKSYTLTMRVYFENALNESLGFWPYATGGSTQYTGFGTQSFNADEWTTVTCNFTATGDHTMLQFPIGHVDGTMRIDDVTLVEQGTTTNLVENGSFDESVSHQGIWSGDGDLAGNTWWSWNWAKPTVTYDATYDEAAPVYDPVVIYPAASTNVKDLTGTNKNWSSSVTYPKEFAVQGQAFGDGDGSNESTHVKVPENSKLVFNVSQGSTGLGLRVWLWNGSNVVTLYAHPEADYATADFTQAYKITDKGTYCVNLNGYTLLKGVKAANDWGATALTVDYAYIPDFGNASPKILFQVE